MRYRVDILFVAMLHYLTEWRLAPITPIEVRVAYDEPPTHTGCRFVRYREVGGVLSPGCSLKIEYGTCLDTLCKGVGLDFPILHSVKITQCNKRHHLPFEAGECREYLAIYTS